jgi:hypothetical protein
MGSSLKDSFTKAVTTASVLVLVIIASIILLHILSNKAAEEAPKTFITLTSYVDNVETIGTAPLEKVLLDCQSDSNDCQSVVSAFEDSVEGGECQEAKESIKISGYFNTKLKREIYAGCPGYEELRRVFQENLS